MDCSRQNPDPIDIAITALCELWGKEVSPGFFAIYRGALLSELSEQEAVQGLKMAFVKKTFGFPKPADLIEWVHGAEGDKAITAWAQLITAIERAGPNRTVVFDDPKIAHVVNLLGGWPQVCTWKTKELTFHRKEFTAFYQACHATQNIPLLGNGEISCNLHNRPDLITAPMVIGKYSEINAIESQGGTA